MPNESGTNRRQAGALLLAFAAALVSACGGGGSDATSAASASVPNATAYAAGPISGFGSVIVNDVRYDDSQAEVLDDEDGAHGRDRLKLGMMVEIDGADVDRGLAVGRALRIRFGSEIVGPATDVNAVAGTLTVFGQSVVVTDTTVFDDEIVGGLAGLADESVVEVYAMFDPATATYTATRIELASDARFYKLRGVVADLSTANQTFTLGGRVINYASVPGADARDALENGLRVRVLVRAEPVNGQWIAVRIGRAHRQVDDRAEVDLRGRITAFTSASDFEVNGLPVNATNARFPDGSDGLMLGAAVEVEGAIRAGVLVASKVELAERHHDEQRRFELHGLVSDLRPDPKTFVLRGITVSYGGTVRYEGGTEADLAKDVPPRIEVKGTLSADRTQLEAFSIEFE